MSKRGLVFSVFLALLLMQSGCLTTSDLPFVGAYDKSTNKGKFLELYDFSSVSYENIEETAKEDNRNINLNSLGTVPSSGLQIYAQTILTKIVKAGPKVSFTPKIELLANMSPGALAVPSGTIFINHSMFKYASQEDQIAFIVAHEYSHVLLKHFTSDIIKKARPYYLTAIDITVAQADNADKTEDAIKLYGTDLIARDVLFPSWSRKDEAQADRLGVDLMAAAGYNPLGALSVLDILEKFENEFEASYTTERNALEKTLLSDKSFGTKKSQLNVTEIIQSGLIEAQKILASDHPKIKERKNDLYVYIEREYPDTEFREYGEKEFRRVVSQNEEILDKYEEAFKIKRMLASKSGLPGGNVAKIDASARWMVSGATKDHPYTRNSFSLLREYKRQNDLALKNLELTQGDDGFLPGPMEQNRILWLEKKGKRAAAYDRTKQVGEYYDWPLIFYVDAIKLARSLNLKWEANDYRVACIATYPQSRALCQ